MMRIFGSFHQLSLSWVGCLIFLFFFFSVYSLFRKSQVTFVNSKITYRKCYNIYTTFHAHIYTYISFIHVDGYGGNKYSFILSYFFTSYYSKKRGSTFSVVTVHWRSVNIIWLDQTTRPKVSQRSSRANCSQLLKWKDRDIIILYWFGIILLYNSTIKNVKDVIDKVHWFWDVLFKLRGGRSLDKTVEKTCTLSCLVLQPIISKTHQLQIKPRLQTVQWQNLTWAMMRIFGSFHQLSLSWIGCIIFLFFFFFFQFTVYSENLRFTFVNSKRTYRKCYNIYTTLHAHIYTYISFIHVDGYGGNKYSFILFYFFTSYYSKKRGSTFSVVTVHWRSVNIIWLDQTTRPKVSQRSSRANCSQLLKWKDRDIIILYWF